LFVGFLSCIERVDAVMILLSPDILADVIWTMSWLALNLERDRPVALVLYQRRRCSGLTSLSLLQRLRLWAMHDPWTASPSQITIHRSNCSQGYPLINQTGAKGTINLPQLCIIYTCRYISLCLHVLIWSQGYPLINQMLLPLSVNNRFLASQNILANKRKDLTTPY
jgi:hypothetical protein